uniref:Uncharacterized protein n=2 Tax=Aegilops tauschii subsp. strangulata TaxID=200361 RepID=A0A453SGM9_AEGTS
DDLSLPRHPRHSFGLKAISRERFFLASSTLSFPLEHCLTHSPKSSPPAITAASPSGDWSSSEWRGSAAERMREGCVRAIGRHMPGTTPRLREEVAARMRPAGGSSSCTSRAPSGTTSARRPHPGVREAWRCRSRPPLTSCRRGVVGGDPFAASLCRVARVRRRGCGWLHRAAT